MTLATKRRPTGFLTEFMARKFKVQLSNKNELIQTRRRRHVHNGQPRVWVPKSVASIRPANVGWTVRLPVWLAREKGLMR